MIKGLVLLVCACAVSAYFPSVPQHEALSDEIIDYVNYMAQATWKAGPAFQGMPVSYVKTLCGVLPQPDVTERLVKEHDVTRLYLPQEFDARQNWKHCQSLSEIRDQGACGSCWATAAVEAMTDRICIHSQGKINAHLSIEDLMTCCHTCGGGCGGGFLLPAWEYFRDTGIVTGGPYGSKKGCQPYQIKACDHHVNGSLPQCSKTEAPTPACSKECERGYPTPYAKDKHYAKSAYNVKADVKQIQAEILKNGPVEAAFTVYADFPSYKSGVYHHVSGKYLGGHAVKIFGWGTEKGTPYWHVANSWNADWGDKGYFKISRGNNECGIESDITAGIPSSTK